MLPIPTPTSREALYQELWTRPIPELLNRYGVCELTFLTTCRRLHLPVPARHLWPRIAAGLHAKAPPRVPARGQALQAARRFPSSTLKDRHSDVEGHVRGAMVQEAGHLKVLSAATSSVSGPTPSVIRAGRRRYGTSPPPPVARAPLHRR